MRSRQHTAWGASGMHQLAVVAICALLVRSATAAAVRPQPFTLDEVTPSSSLPPTLKTEWATGPVLLHELEGELVAVNIKTNDLEVLVPKKVYANAGVVRAQLSPDQQYLLLTYDLQQVFRDGASARYMAYRLNDERDNKIKGDEGFKTEDSEVVQIGGGERLQLAKWGARGSQLVYIYDNNIYYLPSPGAQPVKVTSDGVPGVVFNGLVKSGSNSLASVAEWQDAVQFSPDGARLLFGQTDLSPVASARLMRYGRPGLLDYQYADLVTFRYAKAGTPMARVALKLATLPSEAAASVSTQRLLAPVDVVSEDHYLEALAWVNDATAMAWWLNRTAKVRQDAIYFVSSDLKEIPGEKALKVERKDGWVDVYAPVFQTGSQTTTYVTILWHPNDANISFPHVVKVTVNSTEAITSGDFTVTKIYGWAANGTIYYEASEVGKPSARQVFAVEEGGAPRCLSCRFLSPEDNACSRASAYFNPDLSWFALTCKGPDPPYSTVVSTAAPEDKKLTSSSRVLRKMLEGKLLPLLADVSVEVGDGVTAQVRLLLPPDLDLEGVERRPAIVYVDAFPDSQVIDDSFGVDILTYLTTYRRYVVILIDGRGSGGKGDRTLFSVHRRLGSVEVDDQISVARWVAHRYPFIDSARVGITGTGYGGYVAAMALARDEQNVFRCAASVAPITSWIYAEMSQAERFMGFPTPEDNEQGYNASDVTRLAERFAGKRFLLVHADADDSVLAQHSMALAAALQDAGVVFQQQSYPDEGHVLRGLRGHAYRTIDDFFRRCFDRTPLLFEIIHELIS